MKKLLIALALATSAFCGQSIVTSTQAARYDTFPNRNHALPWRLEMYIHDWSNDVAQHNLVYSDALGIQVLLQNSGSTVILLIHSQWQSADNWFTLPLSASLTTKAAYLRIQQDTTSTKTLLTEMWDKDGNRVFVKSVVYGSDVPNTNQGIQVGAYAGGTMPVAFFKVFSTLLPLNSRTPITSDNTDTILHWKFDGNMLDSSGNGYTAYFYSGSPTYMATPYQGIFAKAKTFNSPTWSDWVSFRAGQINKLDGTDSYTQADSMSAMQYLWSQTEGDTTLLWDDKTSSTPATRGAVFGTYGFGLTVTDGDGNSASTTLRVGAVATDSKGIVVQAKPEADILFGPMIAYGKSPWSYMDERAMKATTLRAAKYNTLGINPPPWYNLFDGTISYKFGGASGLNGTQARLTVGINNTDLTIVIDDATKFDWSSLPTRLSLSANYYDFANMEGIRICNRVGNTLTVCPGGRASYGTAKSWGIGTEVSQLKVVGTGTSFLSTVCSPAHTDWRTVLQFTRPDGTTGLGTWYLNGCESDTLMYLMPTNDVTVANGVQNNNVKYTYNNLTIAYTSAVGVNFYGEDLAHRALYYRSGWKPAKDAADVMSDQYVTSPYLMDGAGVGSPLLFGGGVYGAVAARVLDGRLKWEDLRPYFNLGASRKSITCDQFDSRDSSYYFIMAALGALFDPDPTLSATYNAAMGDIYTRETTCKGTSADPLINNSWYNAMLFDPGASPALTATNGSAIVTGTGISASLCSGIASGTGNVTNGSNAITGTGFVSGSKIVITGTKSGQPYVVFYPFQYNNSTSITAGGTWDGDTGAMNWQIDNNENVVSIGTDRTDARLNQNWSCTFNSSTQITLNRPWVKAGGGSETVYANTNNITGKGQQPFMLGIKTTEFRLASNLSNGTLATNFANYANLAATWIKTNGYDTTTQGLYYGRIYGSCEPPTALPSQPPSFLWRNIGCAHGWDGIRASRTLTAEASAAVSMFYKYNPSVANKTWIDTAYGSIWGYAPYATNGVYTDDYYVKDENSDGSLADYKWTGFFFGMGMAHMQPAIRLGDIDPEDPITKDVVIDLASHGATSARLVVTAPSSKQTTYTCASSPCAVTLDRRQGEHWEVTTYLNGSGVVVGSDSAILINPSGSDPIAPPTIHIPNGGLVRFGGRTSIN